MKSLVLVGHPRSGTTFLHTFLSSSTSNYSGQTLSQLVDGVWPFSFLIKDNKFWNLILQNVFCNAKYHKVKWSGPECLDVGQFFLNRSGYLDFIYNHVLSNKRVNIAYLEEYFNRKARINIEAYKWYATKAKASNHKWIHKSFSAIFFENQFSNYFSSPKVIILRRSTDDILKSYKLMLNSVIKRRFTYNHRMDKYESNLTATVQYYQKQLSAFILRNPTYCVVDYNELLNDFLGVVERISRYVTDLELDNNIAQKQALVQNNRKKLR